ncbi:MAG: ATP synthase F1 subunit delta [bacterium]|nr:ATP synthase F1 subunit delta [bacterium]
MIAAEVAKKYANALFLSTGERGLVDQAYDQFSGLKQALETDDSLLSFLSSPKVADEQKLDLIHTVFGERMEQLFVEFLAVLVKKRRAGYMVEVIDEFNRLVEFEKGISRVTVTTAVPLTDVERGNLLSTLAEKTGKKIELESKIEPAIIGGMIVIMHDEIVDGSVRHGLDLLEDQLQKIKVH